MGIFTSSQQRSPYVPKASLGLAGADATLLGGLENSASGPATVVVRVSGNEPGDVAQATPDRTFRGVAPNTEPPPGSPEFESAMTKAVGHPVVLPNGLKVPDPNSDSGFLMSPIADLQPVATAGREVGRRVKEMLSDPDTVGGAGTFLYASAGKYLGHGGVFDYQREGNHLTGFTQYPHFRDVSNFNVGIFAHQAGMSLNHALVLAGTLSTLAGRPDYAQPHFLQERTAEFIKRGYDASASGAFDPFDGP